MGLQMLKGIMEVHLELSWGKEEGLENYALGLQRIMRDRGIAL